MVSSFLVILGGANHRSGGGCASFTLALAFKLRTVYPEAALWIGTAFFGLVVGWAIRASTTGLIRVCCGHTDERDTSASLGSW